MAPHPMKEVDQERKEELMIAKQLRQSRVTILPRMLDSPNFLSANTSPYSSKSPSPSPNYIKHKGKANEDLPSNWSPASKDSWASKYQGPSKKDVEAASNPIALRYWNQCLTKAAHVEITVPEITTQAPVVDTSWQESPPWALADEDLSATNEIGGRKESLIEKKCSIKVPDIKRHMNKPESVKPLSNKPWSGSNGKQVNKPWMQTARSNQNPDNLTYNGNGNTVSHIKTHKWSETLVQRSENISETTYELPTFEISEPHDDPSPIVERKSSINKPQMTRNNEAKEAAQNIGRYITIDQIDVNGKNKKSAPISKSNGTMELKHNSKAEIAAPPIPPKNSKQSNCSQEKAEVFVTPPETRQNSPGEEYHNKSMSHNVRGAETQPSRVNIPQENFIHMKPAKQKCDRNEKEESVETKKGEIPKTAGKDDSQILLDATSDMSTLADMLLPQLNSMQKNHLGLVFFNQLSNNIVEDIFIQQLSIMSGAKLTNALKNVDKKVLEHIVPKLIPLLNQEMLMGVMMIMMNSLKTEEKAEVVNNSGEEDASEICSKLLADIEKKKKHELIKTAINNEDDDDLIEELFKDYLKRKNLSENEDGEIYSENEEVAEDKNAVDENENVNNYTGDDVTEIESEGGEDLQDMDEGKEIVGEDLEKSDAESWEWEEEYDDESYSVETFNGEFKVALVN